LFALLGALFGASIGSNIGARNAVDRAKKEEMERLGLSQDMLDMAQDIGMSLQRSNEGLEAVQASLDTQQRFARRLDADATDLYERANVALANSNDDLARKLLLERTEVQEKLKKVLINCAEEKGRFKKMQENIAQLERRALEVDSLLRRNVSAKTIQDSSDLGLSLRSEDPLLKKFRDMGID
jgi:phage shock protein A